MPLALFDLDGTLVDQAHAAAQWANEFGGQRSLTPVQINWVARVLAERRSKGEVFRDVVDRLGMSDEPLGLWDEYRRRMPELVSCADGVLDALSSLRAAGWTIGITGGVAYQDLHSSTIRSSLSTADARFRVRFRQDRPKGWGHDRCRAAGPEFCWMQQHVRVRLEAIP